MKIIYAILMLASVASSAYADEDVVCHAVSSSAWRTAAVKLKVQLSGVAYFIEANSGYRHASLFCNLQGNCAGFVNGIPFTGSLEKAKEQPYGLVAVHFSSRGVGFPETTFNCQ